jgi:hypothetical protein
VLADVSARCMDDRKRQIVEGVIDELSGPHVDVCSAGNARGHGFYEYIQRSRVLCPVDHKLVFRIVRDIPHVYERRASWCTDGYEGKHAIERWRSEMMKGDTYVGVGQFIVAMVLCGFECTFNEAKRSDAISVYGRFKATRIWYQPNHVCHRPGKHATLRSNR